jgi:hypothetical protein
VAAVALDCSDAKTLMGMINVGSTALALMSFICASVINHDITKVMGH